MTWVKNYLLSYLIEISMLPRCFRGPALWVSPQTNETRKGHAECLAFPSPGWLSFTPSRSVSYVSTPSPMAVHSPPSIRVPRNPTAKPIGLSQLLSRNGWCTSLWKINPWLLLILAIRFSFLLSSLIYVPFGEDFIKIWCSISIHCWLSKHGLTALVGNL